jgi:hypothetical protein
VSALTYRAPTSLTDDDILALYALRCASAHDYALTHANGRERRLTRRFLLDDGSTLPFVEHATVRWTGAYTDRSRWNETRVSLRALGDLAEAAVATVQTVHQAAKLKVTIAGGLDELLARFTIQQR